MKKLILLAMLMNPCIVSAGIMGGSIAGSSPYDFATHPGYLELNGDIANVTVLRQSNTPYHGLALNIRWEGIPTVFGPELALVNPGQSAYTKADALAIIPFTPTLGPGGQYYYVDEAIQRALYSQLPERPNDPSKQYKLVFFHSSEGPLERSIPLEGTLNITNGNDIDASIYQKDKDGNIYEESPAIRVFKPSNKIMDNMKIEVRMILNAAVCDGKSVDFAILPANDSYVSRHYYKEDALSKININLNNRITPTVEYRGFYNKKYLIFMGDLTLKNEESSDLLSLLPEGSYDIAVFCRNSSVNYASSSFSQFNIQHVDDVDDPDDGQDNPQLPHAFALPDGGCKVNKAGKCKIFDMRGRLIRELNAGENEIIKLQDAAKGMYFLNMDGEKTLKFINK